MKILSFDKLPSTNQYAKKLKDVKEWTVVWAKEQERGYGKEKRCWYSPKGGLYFSIIIPDLKIKDLEFLTLACAVAVCRALKKIGVKSFIKHPNDILVEENGFKKICGILSENVILSKRVKSAIIGIGLDTNIDVFPRDLNQIATSIKKSFSICVENEKILNSICNQIKSILKQERKKVLEEYNLLKVNL